MTGFALGPLIAALAFDLTLSYSGAFTSFIVLVLVGTALIAAAKPPSRRDSPT